MNFAKRVDGIIYLWYRTRIAIEINFEFGLEKGNLMRRSFHSDEFRGRISRVVSGGTTSGKIFRRTPKASDRKIQEVFRTPNASVRDER